MTPDDDPPFRLYWVLWRTVGSYIGGFTRLLRILAGGPGAESFVGSWVWPGGWIGFDLRAPSRWQVGPAAASAGRARRGAQHGRKQRGEGTRYHFVRQILFIYYLSR
jgi:hypothetical protein